MPPVWDKTENKTDGIYEPVERHSPGMISFAYETSCSEEVREALKDTETFKSLVHPALNGDKPLTPAGPQESAPLRPAAN